VRWGLDGLILKKFKLRHYLRASDIAATVEAFISKQPAEPLMSDLSVWCLRHYGALHDFAGPVATACAAAAAVFVTWRLGRGQLRIAQQQAQLALVRLQHDLFERRIAVFDAVRDLIKEVVHTSNVSDVAWITFLRGVETTEFLFDQEITNYVADLRNRAARLRLAVSRLADENLPVGSERSEFAQQRHDQSIWLVTQSDSVVSKFKPALALEQRTATRH